MILFSVQDMFGYLRAHSTMSGIQRVQAGIALSAIAENAEEYGFITNDLTEAYRDGEFRLLPTDDFRKMLAYVSGPQVDHDALRLMLDECEDKSDIIRPRRGDTIILFGAFWGHGNTLDRYVTAKRDGVTIGAYVYDIIPVTHPEYCVAELARDFTMSVGELALVVDFIFTISDYTRHALRRLLEQTGTRPIPMRTVPLAHSLTVTSEVSGSWPAALRGIEGRPYVAYVSTVEGRKNHLYVVNAWRQLIEDGVNVPDLVFVGRRGWRVGGLDDVLDGTLNLNGRVHIVRDLSDAELDTVYARCEFTVFTSFVEGWGLPVGESLVHGVPCVASSVSSIPEVGGDLVNYVDPYNLRDGIAVFRRLIEDRAYLAAQRAAIAERFVPRSWQDVGRDFIAKTREALKVTYPPHATIPKLPEGTKFSVSDLVTEPVDVPTYFASPMRLALAESFYKPEEFGAWMRGSAGQVHFATDLAPGTPVMVYLEWIVPVNDTRLRVQTAGSDPTALKPAIVLSAGRQFVRVAGAVSEDGTCTVAIELENDVLARDNDHRRFGIGIVGIGYAAVDNLAARSALLERFAFHDMSRGAR